MIKIAMAAAGTIAFAVLFSVPSNLYLACGITGAVGFGVYDAAVFAGMTPALSTFLATLVVSFLSRFLAVWEKAPAIIFTVTGIFPLVPGAGIYWTAYYLVTGELRQALYAGFDAVKAAAAIALGMIMIFEIPNRFFHKGTRGTRNI